jgi:DNA replication factor GINS
MDMDLDDLRQTQADERRSEKLQELSDTFYEDAAEYIEGLRRKRDACDDPYSDEAQRLNDALNSARQVTEAIYERRVGKVVKMASLSANGHPASEDRMTREEREMFDSIVSEIRTNQNRIEETLEGALKNPETETKKETGTPETSDAESAEPTQNDEPQQESQTDGYTTVRVVESLPEFVGTDGREYELGEEDVARIPEENARALCEKEAAVEVGRNS